MCGLYAAAFAEPEAEAGEKNGGDGELESERRVGGGEEGLEEAGDDQQGDGSGEQSDGFAAGEGECVAAAQHAGEEQAGGQAEAGTAGDEDAGQLQRAVSGDEAPDAEGHVVLGASGSDDTDAHAVGEHKEDGAKAGEDASCVGVEADGDVVGHDGAGCLGFGGEDRVGPHLVVLDRVDHSGAEHGVHELGTGDCQERSEECAGEEDREGSRGVGQEAAEDSGVAFGEEVPDAAEVHAVAGVDVIMGAADEAIQVCFEGAGGLVGADGGEVGRGLAVEQTELSQVGG